MRIPRFCSTELVYSEPGETRGFNVCKCGICYHCSWKNQTVTSYFLLSFCVVSQLCAPECSSFPERVLCSCFFAFFTHHHHFLSCLFQSASSVALFLRWMSTVKIMKVIWGKLDYRGCEKNSEVYISFAQAVEVNADSLSMCSMD